jgi:hypothetical protein
MLQNGSLVAADEYSSSEADRQDILVLARIFAEAGKPRLSVPARRSGACACAKGCLQELHGGHGFGEGERFGMQACSSPLW